jgi:HK97 family phage major capsid protein
MLDQSNQKETKMKMTDLLKKELVKLGTVKEDGADDEFTKAAGEAFANGKLTAERYLELTKEPEDDAANAFEKRLNGIATAIEKLSTALTKEAGMDDGEKDNKEVEELKAKLKELEEKQTKGGKKPDGEKKVSNISRLITDIGNRVIDGKDVDVRVKEAIEQYSDTKSAMCYPDSTKSGKPHPMAGRQVQDFTEEGRPIDEPSERDKAVAGVYAKLLCATAARNGSRSAGYQSLPDHDKSILHYAMDKEKWSGASDGGDAADIKRRLLTPNEQKALIDDATSGGLEAAPIVFDDQVIKTPLLYGELYPLVTTKPLTRGRRVEGVALGQVTVSWGGVDDTAISLFNTASFVSAFDTTIYRGQGAIKIGLDFLSDTPINFGQEVTQQYGEAMLQTMDYCVAVGNGTTQPEGVMNKSGVTSVAWGGTTSIGNYESLRFGVSKAEHRDKSSAVFCGTETSYSRMKALPVGANDARRLFGSGGMGTSGYDDYRLMDRPYKINEDLTNSQIFYAILARYRMYRREGLTMKTSTQGDTLMRANEMLMLAMFRFGGQMERAACASITTTAPA